MAVRNLSWEAKQQIESYLEQLGTDGSRHEDPPGTDRRQFREDFFSDTPRLYNEYFAFSPLRIALALGANYFGRDVKSLDPRPGLHDELASLSRGLMAAAASCGGKLGVDKNYRGGALLKTLDLLRDGSYMPYIPRHLPAHTLQKVRTDWLKTTGQKRTRKRAKLVVLD